MQDFYAGAPTAVPAAREREQPSPTTVRLFRVTSTVARLPPERQTILTPARWQHYHSARCQLQQGLFRTVHGDLPSRVFCVSAVASIDGDVVTGPFRPTTDLRAVPIVHGASEAAS